MADHRVLIDTGPLVAIFSNRDAHHERCVATLSALAPPLVTCWPVLTEVCWLLRQRPATIQKLFDGFRDGLFELLPLDDLALEWIPKFLDRYESAGPQLADAALVYLAEREQIRTVFTLDRRDFGIFRLSRNRALTLIPEPE